MYDYVYIMYAFVKFLDEPPVIICLSCHPGQTSWLQWTLTPLLNLSVCCLSSIWGIDQSGTVGQKQEVLNTQLCLCAGEHIPADEPKEEEKKDKKEKAGAKGRFIHEPRAKSHDHEIIVRAQKKSVEGCPNTPPKSCRAVMDPQV